MTDPKTYQTLVLAGVDETSHLAITIDSDIRNNEEDWTTIFASKHIDHHLLRDELMREGPEKQGKKNLNDQDSVWVTP